MNSKKRISLVVLGLLIVVFAGLAGFSIYYADLPNRLSQHETLVLGQTRFTPGSTAAVRVVVRDTQAPVIALDQGRVTGAAPTAVSAPQGSLAPFGFSTYPDGTALITLAHSNQDGLFRNGSFASVIAAGQAALVPDLDAPSNLKEIASRVGDTLKQHTRPCTCRKVRGEFWASRANLGRHKEIR